MQAIKPVLFSLTDIPAGCTHANHQQLNTVYVFGTIVDSECHLLRIIHHETVTPEALCVEPL